MTVHAFPAAAAWLRPLLLLTGTRDRSAVTVSAAVVDVADPAALVRDLTAPRS